MKKQENIALAGLAIGLLLSTAETMDGAPCWVTIVGIITVAASAWTLNRIEKRKGSAES